MQACWISLLSFGYFNGVNDFVIRQRREASMVIVLEKLVHRAQTVKRCNVWTQCPFYTQCLVKNPGDINSNYDQVFDSTLPFILGKRCPKQDTRVTQTFELKGPRPFEWNVSI